MSNVLIGIIGVILFIGLALAGALFLGPRFQQATQNSKAAAAIQLVTQVSSALSLYALNEGAPVDLGQSGSLALQPGNPLYEGLVDKGYLKTVTLPPVAPDALNVALLNGRHRVLMQFRKVNAAAEMQGLCQAINKQLGNVDAEGNPIITSGQEADDRPVGAFYANTGGSARCVVFSRG